MRRRRGRCHFQRERGHGGEGKEGNEGTDNVLMGQRLPESVRALTSVSPNLAIIVRTRRAVTHFTSVTGVLSTNYIGAHIIT